MESAINGAKELIQKQIFLNGSASQISIYQKYDRVYAFTNENIYGYMNQLDFEGKDNALCIMSSGDHPFNAALYGIKDIDTFDVNILTEYYVLGIKRSAILAFDYINYISFMNKLLDENTSLDQINDLINLIIPYMDEKYKIYWRSLIDYYHYLQKDSRNYINIFRLLLLDINKLDGYMVNSYLKDEISYNKLRSNIGKLNINFKECCFNDLTNSFNNEYDFIFLSNILDYLHLDFDCNWDYKKLVEIEQTLMPLLKNDGMIALNYIYNYFYINYNRYSENIINCTNFTKNDLTVESIIKFPHVLRNKVDRRCEAGLLLVKKY